MSLKKKAAKGSIWISVTRTGINIIDFIVYAYLARILTLEEFGIVGFCLLFIEFTNSVVNSGINQNLVQRKTWDIGYASSTLLFMFGISLILASFLVVVIAPIAYYSYSSVAAYVIASLAPITILISIQVVVSGKLIREFKNKQMGIAKFIAAILSGTITIFLATTGYGLWSLVIGKLSNALLELLFLTIVSKFIPMLHYRKSDTRELIDFCLPLLWSSMLNFGNLKVGAIFTGAVLGPVYFALLNAAKKGEIMITQVTLSSINSMVVPGFSRVKKEEDVGDSYIKMVSITSTLILPIFMGLAAIADPFVTIAFGEKFIDSAIFMSISVFTMFPSVLVWFLPNLLISRGHTKQALKINSINVASNIIVVALTIWFGVSFMLLSVVVINCLLLPLKFRIVSKSIKIDGKKLICTLYPQYLSALILFILVISAKSYLANYMNDLLLLVSLIGIGTIIYPLTFFLLFNKQFMALVNNGKQLLTKKKNKV